MKNTTTLIILGIIVATLPFAGLPGTWRDALSVVIGLAITTIVYVHVRAHRKAGEQSHTENNPEEGNA